MSKIVILSFSEGEEEVCQRILQILSESTRFEGCNELQVEKNISIGEMKLDLLEKNVIIHGTEVMLTNREFEILYLLAQSPGRIFSKGQIYDIVWQEPYSGDYNIVMSHIRHIREKIEDNPGKPLYIQTVWGIGYRFNKNLSSSL
ncbi:winged helix-turn-helix domain-containing protein [Lachnospiraceae bacterium 48-42]